jgi:hypothetical protein
VLRGAIERLDALAHTVRSSYQHCLSARTALS